MASKTALFLHGWPRYKVEDHFFTDHLEDKGYKIIVPELFGPKFDFSDEAIYKQIIKKLGGEKPDLIVGISFGGIILPGIAASYPNAKLILIATGTSFKPEPKFFKFLMEISKSKTAVKVAQKILDLPASVIKVLYKAGYPFKGTTDERKVYEEDLARNVISIKNIPAEKDAELVKFAFKTDNTNILKTLKNKSLIFSGTKDCFMPEGEGRLLHEFLSNSNLIVSDRGQHFDIFTAKDLPEVEKFLGY